MAGVRWECVFRLAVCRVGVVVSESRAWGVRTGRVIRLTKGFLPFPLGLTTRRDFPLRSWRSSRFVTSGFDSSRFPPFNPGTDLAWSHFGRTRYLSGQEWV